jgi:hypothetical protein
LRRASRSHPVADASSALVLGDQAADRPGGTAWPINLQWDDAGWPA